MGSRPDPPWEGEATGRASAPSSDTCCRPRGAAPGGGGQRQGRKEKGRGREPGALVAGREAGAGVPVLVAPPPHTPGPEKVTQPGAHCMDKRCALTLKNA